MADPLVLTGLCPRVCLSSSMGPRLLEGFSPATWAAPDFCFPSYCSICRSNKRNLSSRHRVLKMRTYILAVRQRTKLLGVYKKAQAWLQQERKLRHTASLWSNSALEERSPEKNYPRIQAKPAVKRCSPLCPFEQDMNVMCRSNHRGRLTKRRD